MKVGSWKQKANTVTVGIVIGSSLVITYLLYIAVSVERAEQNFYSNSNFTSYLES